MYELRLVKKKEPVKKSSIKKEFKYTHTNFFSPSNYSFYIDKIISFHDQDITSSCVSDNLLFVSYVDGTIQIISLENYKLLAHFTYHKGCVYSIALDNNLLYSVSSDKTIRCYDLENNKLKYAILAHNNHIYNIFIEGNFFVTSSLDRTIKIWDKENKKLIKEINTENKTAWVVKIKENKIFAGFSDGNIKIWDLNSGELLAENKDHSAGITTFDFYEHYLFSASKDGTIKIYDINDFELKRSVEISKYSINSFAFDDDRLIANLDDKGMKLINYAFEETEVIFTKNFVHSVLNYYSRIISSGNDGIITIINKIPKYNNYNIDLNFEEPKKSPFETELEYQNRKNDDYNIFIARLLSYDYINIGEVEILPENYDINTSNFNIKVKITADKIQNFSNLPKVFNTTIQLSPDEAKSLATKTIRELYIQYFHEKDLDFKIFINDNHKKYILDKIQKESKKEKFSISKDRLHVNKLEKTISSEKMTNIPKHSCNTIDISDTFRNPFEEYDAFYKRVCNKLIKYQDINIGKIELLAEKYDLENELFPLDVNITCDKILNIINIDKQYISNIKIDRFTAKKVADINRKNNLYIKFLINENKLFFEIFTVILGQKYFIK
ncbi:MAG: WD40 repeat domain-containing protein [Candidatus Sericytochromatia bacterium]